MSQRPRIDDPERRTLNIEKAFRHLWSPNDSISSLLMAGRFRRSFSPALKTRSLCLTHWSRWSIDEERGSIWPKALDYDGAVIRLPKSKDELSYLVHATASRLTTAQPVWVIGANDEGVKSAGKYLAPFFEDIKTVGSKHHCRLLHGVRSHQPASESPEDMLSVGCLPLDSKSVSWRSMPGLFAKGSLDDATALLINCIADLGPIQSALDFACGTGPIAHQVRAHSPEAIIHMSDADAVAVYTAQHNVPGALGHISDGWRHIPPGPYDLIISNPPIHTGKAEDHSILEDLISGSTQRLTTTGRLLVVAQGRLPLEKYFKSVFPNPRCVSRTPRFQVWSNR